MYIHRNVLPGPAASDVPNTITQQWESAKKYILILKRHCGVRVWHTKGLTCIIIGEKSTWCKAWSFSLKLMIKYRLSSWIHTWCLKWTIHNWNRLYSQPKVYVTEVSKSSWKRGQSMQLQGVHCACEKFRMGSGRVMIKRVKWYWLTMPWKWMQW